MYTDRYVFLGIRQFAPVTVLRDEAKFKLEALKVVETSSKAKGNIEIKDNINKRQHKGNIEIGLLKELGASGKYVFFETWETLEDANTDTT